MSVRITPASQHHPLHTKRRTIRAPLTAQRFLAAFEGIEGGFAIGASLLVALSFSDMERSVVVSTIIVTLIVSGFNTASVKYSSEHFLDELDGREKKSAFRHYFVPSLIEFISYFAISLITILPLLLIADITKAAVLSVLLTLVILYCAGYWRAYMLQMPTKRDALETFVLGAGIILVGLVSGYFIQLV